MFPGSTIFPVTVPSKGAAIVVKDGMVFAWSLAAWALSIADAPGMFERGTGDAGFGTAQRRGGVVEFLRGGGPFGLEAGDAIVGRTCEGQASFRGQELRCSRLRSLFGGQGR